MKFLERGANMKKIEKRFILVIALSMMMILMLTTIALANSARGPSLVILINNPPKDLSITLISTGNQPERVWRVAWEGYYAFYSLGRQTNDKYTFKVTADGQSFECTVDSPVLGDRCVYNLDIPNHKLTLGTYPFRQAILVSIRVVATLLIEGMIFRLFGFIQKKSWIIFICINLITQGYLNFWLNNENLLNLHYIGLSLFMGEIIVFLVEMILFPLLICEHKKTRSVGYAFTANFVSLIAGGFLISLLPV